MSTIEIQTTQNVSIEYPVASIGERIVAAIIDVLIMVGYVLAVFFLFIWLLNATEGSAFYFPVAYGVIFFLPVFFYHLLCETFLNGQSFGKKIMKMRVVRLDGSQAGIGSFFLRWILSPIDYFLYGAVGIVTMLVNGKGQRLGDLAANTTVVKLKTEAKLDDTILRTTPVNYEIKFPQVTALSDKYIAIIKEVLDMNYKNPDIFLYEQMLQKTKAAVEKKIGISTTLRAITFLDTILKDYNYLLGK